MPALLIIVGAALAAVWALNARAVHRKLNCIHTAVSAVHDQGVATMADLSALTAAVTDDLAVDQSAITLLEGLAAELAAAKTDPVAIQALADQLTAQSAELAAAVVANTPAE